MDNEVLLRIVAEMPLLAFLLYAWNSERKDRIAITERYMTRLETDQQDSVK